MNARVGADLSSPDLAERISGRSLPAFIAIEGPIGVGKTTLAERLAQTLGYGQLLEQAGENPFLNQFYLSGGSNALATQLYFLLQRAQQLEALNPGELLRLDIVSDFLIQKDDLFAVLNLEPHEYTLYQEIHDSLRIRPPVPDLVIYLQAPTEVLLQRIRQRGIAAEQRIEPAYLEALVAAYTDFFHHYDAAPLLIVNAAEIDLANNQQHYEALLERALLMDGTRQFFNPHPTLI